MREEMITIVATMVVIALAFGGVIGHIVGYQQGIQYQKDQPVNISFQSITNGEIVTTNYDPITPDRTLGLPTTGEFIEKNNITSWYIRVIP